MRHCFLLLGLLILFSGRFSAQSTVTLTCVANTSDEPALPVESIFTVEAGVLPDDKDDPGYRLYKEAKKLIFNEQWTEARGKFSELLKKYPTSSYRDDAAYWSAYALKHTDRKKAIDAYRKFMKDYLHSNYYDDAVADYTELTGGRPAVPGVPSVPGEPSVYLTREGVVLGEGSKPMRIDAQGVVIGEGPDSLVVGKNSVTVHSDGKSFSYAYSYAPKARAVERALRATMRRMNRIALTRSQFMSQGIGKDQTDPQTQLRLEAIYAIGGSREDDKSFQTLRNVAVDLKQPLQLREAALEAMADYTKHDILSVYIDVARHDTNIDLQNSAIEYITEHIREKDKAVVTLIDLYQAIPRERQEERQSIFYAIADIGNDRSVDFLASVARNDQDYELRKDAIYYLGSIGGERARAALYGILGEK